MTSDQSPEREPSAPGYGDQGPAGAGRDRERENAAAKPEPKPKSDGRD